MSNAQQEAAQQAYAEVLSKAWGDPAFKKQLMSDPKAAIESIKGSAVNIPAGKELRVVDHTDDKYIYITIPKQPEMEEVELTDEQLELVSGGRMTFPWINWLWRPPVIFW